MKLPFQVKGIEVCYDGRCGMCCTFQERVCAVLAANRHGLSKIFFRRKDREVREHLHEIPGPEPCEEDACVA